MRLSLLATGLLWAFSTVACGGRTELDSVAAEGDGPLRDWASGGTTGDQARDEVETGSLYEDYCGTHPEDSFCTAPQVALPDAIERALSHPDLPADALLIGVRGRVVLPDGVALGRWDLTLISESTGSTYDVVVNDSVRVTPVDIELDCSPHDAIEWEDIPPLIGEATRQALAELEWEIQPNEFYPSFDRYSDCHWWTEWGLSYFSFQRHAPDATGYLNWVYVEYTLDGELVQVCRIEEDDDCVNRFGRYDD